MPTMVAMITKLMQQLCATGEFRAETDPADAAETYISLLMGEVPLRQALGRLGPLSGDDIALRATRAMDHLRRIYTRKA